MGGENFMKIFIEAKIGRGEAWLVSESIVGLCSTEERKELVSYLHVPRAATVFCQSVRVF